MGKWFAVKVASQKEDQVVQNIIATIKTRGLESKIKNVIAPKEKIKKMKGGKEIVAEKKLFPGYVLIEVDTENETLDDVLWYSIKESPGVAHLVGSGTPVPLTDAEAMKISQITETKEPPKIKIDYAVGNIVRVIDGPFENFEGKVEAINKQKGIVTVTLVVFGRETKVDFECWQVEKV